MGEPQQCREGAAASSSFSSSPGSGQGGPRGWQGSTAPGYRPPTAGSSCDGADGEVAGWSRPHPPPHRRSHAMEWSFASPTCLLLLETSENGLVSCYCRSKVNRVLPLQFASYCWGQPKHTQNISQQRCKGYIT